MRRLVPIIFIAVLLVGVILFLGTHIIVKSAVGVTTLQKDAFTLSPIFLDVSTWGPVELASNPALVTLFVKQGKVRYLPGGEVIAGFNDAAAGAARAVDNLFKGVQATDGRKMVDRAAAATKQLLQGNASHQAAPVHQPAPTRDSLFAAAKELAIALEGYAVDHHCYPTSLSLSGLRQALVPTYTRELPSETDLVVSSSPRSYVISSSDGTVILEGKM